MQVLIADDSRANRTLIAQYVTEAGHEVSLAEDGLEAVRLFKDRMPDLVIMDVIMPRLDGLGATRRIRRLCRLRDLWIPIILLTARNEDEDLAVGIEAGADDYLIKPVSPVVLQAKLKAMQRIATMRTQLERANAELRALSGQDGLTGIANRRRFDEQIRLEWRRCRRDGYPLALVLADVDYFKRYNDHYGHLQGDDCLIAVAGALKRCVQRAGDLVARYGGEEFAILLPNTDSAGAACVAERVRAAVEALQLPHAASDTAPVVTLSMGVAVFTPQQLGEATPEDLIHHADQALYQAKAQGRNRVTVNTAVFEP